MHILTFDSLLQNINLNNIIKKESNDLYFNILSKNLTLKKFSTHILINFEHN